MSDLKVERKESVSREDAAVWLDLMSRAFAAGSHVELPLGGGSVSLHVPDQVHAEFEVEVDGDEIEVELEFKWPTGRPDAATRQDAKAPEDRSRRDNGARGPAKATRRRR
jgi:amphi-Trp domain-containing protein